MLNTFFVNYETAKLPIGHPTLQNLAILLLLLFFSVAWLKKQSTVFMDRNQTDQVRGIAILLVVVGHLWVHVSSKMAVPVLSGYSVSMFLILSGYGLTLSWSRRPLGTGEFIRRRLTRVMIPYWVVTTVILLLDYMILARTYSLGDILSTYAGMNFKKLLRLIDYTRWYITLLLIYYALFFVSNRFLGGLKAIAGLTGAGLFLICIRRLEIFPFGSPHQLIAFPVGCWLAFFHGDIARYLQHRGSYGKSILLLVAVAAAGFSAMVLVQDSGGIFARLIRFTAPNTTGLVLCLLLILIVGKSGSYGYVSRFLAWCGIISYEVYLIHGPLLIKYNPVFRLLPVNYIVLSFAVLLLLVLILSFWAHQLLGPKPARDIRAAAG